jgi:hypothetical protein
MEEIEKCKLCDRNKLRADNEKLREGIKEIAEGKGAYSVDRQTHADNTIREMKFIAEQLLKETE